MQFCKMNGAGNDFIILNNMAEHLPHDVFPAMAKVLCHRHLSIGADGLMAVLPSGSGWPLNGSSPSARLSMHCLTLRSFPVPPWASPPLFSYSITHNRRAGKVCADEKREKIL